MDHVITPQKIEMMNQMKLNCHVMIELVMQSVGTRLAGYVSQPDRLDALLLICLGQSFEMSAHGRVQAEKPEEVGRRIYQALNETIDTFEAEVARAVGDQDGENGGGRVSLKHPRKRTESVGRRIKPLGAYQPMPQQKKSKEAPLARSNTKARKNDSNHP